MLGRETHVYILVPLLGYEINDIANQKDGQATCEEGKKEINVRKGWKQGFHGLVWRAYDSKYKILFLLLLLLLLAAVVVVVVVVEAYLI